MDASLWEHEREIAAVARHRSVLVSSAQPVGKTFVSCALLHEAAGSGSQQLVLAVGASPSDRLQIQRQLARVCGLRVVSSDAKGSVTPSKSNKSVSRWLDDAEWAQQQLEAARGQIAILSPLILQEILRRGLLQLADVALLVVEAWDLVHAELPSFFKLVSTLVEELPVGKELRIFATSRLPASRMDWNPVSNPLLKHIQVLNMVPVLPSMSMEPSFPPLLCETFEATRDEVEQVGVRDFLLGQNGKKVDLVHVFRLELELGNSAAVYDEKKKQDKVNRFIQDAEAVDQHLGRWCLWKFVELELQTNLQACVVEEPENVNNRRKRRQDTGGDEPMDGGGIDSDSDMDNGPEDGEVQDDEDGDEAMGANTDAKEQSQAAKTDRLIARFLGAKVEIDDTTRHKVRPIVKVLAWLSAQSKICGTLEASPRLLKTAEVVRNRFSNTPETKDVRAWVFLQRRCHCRVVAEYLSAALADLRLPPSCCMLGSSNARISGALRFSSFLKVMKMFASLKTKIMVTTSVAKKSQKMRIDPPLCDLVVVMDELLEPNKLYEFGMRASASVGAIKYITEGSAQAVKKFEGLVLRMQEYIRLEQENLSMGLSLPQPAISTTSSADSAQMPEPTTTLSDEKPSTAGSTLAFLQTAKRVSVAPKRIQPVVNPYEIINRDTGAILNVSNSVSCLSKFCDTLPGLDTYDRRPQYIVKRISIAKHVAPSLKRSQKKLMKYNAKLTDKIDILKAEAEQRSEAAAAADSRDGSNDKDGAATANIKPTAVKDERFNYSASLKLPGALGIKKQLISHKVETQAEAKGIVAFKACQELVKKGLIDRHFRSKLLDDQATIHRDAENRSGRNDNSTADDTIVIGEDDNPLDNNPQLTDLSTQSSYDLPPVSAVELSLRPIRSLTQEAAISSEEGEEWSTTMCLYGLTGLRFAILSTNELYTGNTNTGWRYDFATSGVMTPEIQPVTLAKRPLKLSLTKSELHEVLHFHLVVMRLACMGVQDAVRDVDIANDNVWNEFSEQNDKGYLVVPSILDETTQPATLSLDWSYVREIISKPLLEPLWPFPAIQPEKASEETGEWICVPTNRLNASYVVHAISDKTVDDIRKKYLASNEAWLTHLKKGKSTRGNPIPGRWHTREQLEEADATQPMIHAIQTPPIVPIIRRVMQRNNDEGSIAQYKTKFNERLLVPQYTSRLRLTKSRFFEAMGLVPLLYEFERKCQISHLMSKIGMEVDMALLDDATSKPAYERLEILGDTYLKLETSWYMFDQRKDISQEGQLTQLRRDIIRNDRLNQFALAARLHHYIWYPAEVEQHPFQCWKPSCMGKTPDPVVAPSKWIADVLEAICGAYLVGQGEKGARYFLNWIGVSVLEDPSTNFARPFYPDCFPNELYDAEMTSRCRGGVHHPLSMNFKCPQFEDLPKRLMLLQQRLKYTFRNKRLLLEAVTHPSVGQLVLHIDQMDANSGDADADDGSGGIEVMSRSPKKKKTVWKGDYERLEYLGDALIEYLTLSYAFLMYDKWLPGSLSQWKSATVSNDALGKTALACFGVDECIFAGTVRIDPETMERVARIERKYPAADGNSGLSPAFETVALSRKRGKNTGSNSHALPKMFADVFEALVAAVFLDSGRDLQLIRDVFMGPLLETVGKDAYAYVCRESGLTMDDVGDVMEDLMFSSDEED